MPTALWELPGRLDVPIDETTEWPSPVVFGTRYAPADGDGQPLLMRGVASRMPAATQWTDSNLRGAYRDAVLDNVELTREECRTSDSPCIPALNSVPLSSFIRHYKERDLYAVSRLPARMRRDMTIPPYLRCGKRHERLASAMMWFSAGGSSSVIHADGEDNTMCLFDGTKRFILWHPSQSHLIEDASCGWYNSTAGKEEQIEQFGGRPRLNFEDMDLRRYPGWAALRWQEVTMHGGDCLFVPIRWYHQVFSAPGRNLGVNIWWHRDTSKHGKFERVVSPDERSVLGEEKETEAFGACAGEGWEAIKESPLPVSDCYFARDYDAFVPVASSLLTPHDEGAARGCFDRRLPPMPNASDAADAHPSVELGAPPEPVPPAEAFHGISSRCDPVTLAATAVTLLALLLLPELLCKVAGMRTASPPRRRQGNGGDAPAPANRDARRVRFACILVGALLGAVSPVGSEPAAAIAALATAPAPVTAPSADVAAPRATSYSSDTAAGITHGAASSAPASLHPPPPYLRSRERWYSKRLWMILRRTLLPRHMAALRDADGSPIPHCAGGGDEAVLYRAAWRDGHGTWRLADNTPCAEVEAASVGTGAGRWVGGYSGVEGGDEHGEARATSSFEACDTMLALIHSSGSEAAWELAVRASWALASARLLRVSEAVGLLIAMGNFPNTHTSRRQALIQIAEPFLPLMEPSDAASAHSLLQQIVINEVWGQNFSRAAAALDTMPDLARTLFMGAFAPRGPPPRVIPSWHGDENTLSSPPQRAANGSWETFPLFSTGVSTSHVPAMGLMSRLASLARLLLKKLQQRGQEHGNGELLDFQSEPQIADMIGKQPDARRLRALAHAACTDHILATSPPDPDGSFARYLGGLSVRLWAVVLTPAEEHATHVHEGALCSGVIYVHVPAGSSPILFSDPRGAARHYSARSGDGDLLARHPYAPFVTQVALTPRAGDIVLFPPWLAHAVLPQHRSDEEPLSSPPRPGSAEATAQLRISYAFNLEADRVTSWGVVAAPVL